MKYKAVEIEGGKWAVGAGRGKYFLNTVTDSKEEAGTNAVML